LKGKKKSEPQSKLRSQNAVLKEKKKSEPQSKLRSQNAYGRVHRM